MERKIAEQIRAVKAREEARITKDTIDKMKEIELKARQK